MLSCEFLFLWQSRLQMPGTSISYSLTTGISFTFDRHLKYNSLKIVKMVVIEIFYVIFVYVRKNATAAYYKLVSLHSQIFNNKTNSKQTIS